MDLPVEGCSYDGELQVGALRPVEVEMVLKKSIRRCSADPGVHSIGLNLPPM